MPDRFTRQTPKWRCRPRATSIRGVVKGRVSGSFASSDIIASDPTDKDMMFEPTATKVYRHPTFYEIPEDVGNM